MSRRLAREVALRALFQVEVGHTALEEALAYNATQLTLSERSRPFAIRLSEGTLAHKEKIDEVLSRYAIDWRIERMPHVDRNILRIAMYELLIDKQTPISVAVNEAVHLAKMYGDDKSSRFINGILGNLVREECNEEQSAPE